MGVVASLASAPIAVEIFKDEVRRDKEHKEDMKYGRYRVGDTDLALIKRLSMLEHEEAANGGGSGPFGNNGAHFRDGYTQYTNVEKVYLTGIYRDKYKYLSNKIERNQTFNNNNGSTQVRSAPAAALYSTPMHRPSGYVGRHQQQHHQEVGNGTQVQQQQQLNGYNGQHRRLRSAYPMVRLN